jgi:2-polyprenyl-3-methyl-5-hydroxy-6-metoxy-1,4-benzoquinol methylase
MISSIEQAYSETYQGEQWGRQEIRVRGWPRTRSEACIFWAGHGQRLLDVGCGNGMILYNLRERYSELYGTELASARVETARRTLDGLPSQIFQNNIEDGTEFKNGFFDTVICADVIEHVVNIRPALSEIHRVLKSGGRLVVTTPNIAAFRRRVQLLFGKFPSTSAVNEGLQLRNAGELLDGGHLHYFTFAMLEKILVRLHFVKVERYGFGRLGRLHDICPSLLSSSCMCVAYKG